MSEKRRISTPRTIVVLLLISIAAFAVAIAISARLRTWLGASGSNLGALVAAAVAASVGVLGAYWAALAATRAGVSEADRLENLRLRRMSEYDLYRAASRDFSQLAEQVRDLSFAYVGRKTQTSLPAFLSAGDLSRMHTFALAAKTSIAPMAHGDKALEPCWIAMMRATEAFGWALDKVREHSHLPDTEKSTARLRAKAYIDQTDEVMDAIDQGDESVWERWAPPVQASDMVPFRIAERHMLSEKGCVFAQTLEATSAALMRVAAERLLESFIPGAQTDALGLEKDNNSSDPEERSSQADGTRNAILDALAAHLEADNAPL